MSFLLNDIFKLPEAALAGNKRVPKTMLVSQAMLTRHEQKTLDKVRRLEHFATVQKSTTRILPRVDDDYDIQGIIFLHCEMAGGSEAYADVGRLLHKCFPNPTVIVFDGANHMCISASIVRKSLAEKGATVVEDIQSTGLFHASDKAYAPFLKALAFCNLEQADLLCYQRSITWNIQLSRNITALGFFPECIDRNRSRLAELIAENDRLNNEAMEVFHASRDKDISLNDKAKLRMRKKEINTQGDKITKQIKELCCGRD